MVAMYNITGSLKESIKVLSDFLNVRHKILPLTEDNITLMGETENGDIIRGETEIGHDGRTLKRLFYDEEPEIDQEVIDEILSADLIADLDVWCGMATCAVNWDWVRPRMTNDKEFNVIGGRHPVIEYALRESGDSFVKNDCVLNEFPIALLTGPNMAGKSTYLRQNAILVVLAHMGSFVPAASAEIGICDQLFSRVGASDNLAAGQSTFMVEMSETANILRRATSRSFIIFDEIGRGTATYDGMAIATAVLEYIDTIGARTLFATHYHELTALAVGQGGNLSHVACLTIDVREHNNDIVFMHRIVPGVANRSYGIHVAKMAGMPESVVARAESVLANLEGVRSNNSCGVTENKTSVAPCVESPKPVKKQLSLFE